MHPGQGTLFDEAEDESTNDSDDKKTVTYQRGKPKRKPLPKDLPREDILHELPSEERVCSCGSCLTEIGEQVSEQLDVVPAQFKVLRHIRKNMHVNCVKKG